MSAGYEEYRSVKHFANLDGLRCLCISMVVWHHARPVDLPGIKLEVRGFLGVDFFFVLSGYLITTLLLRESARFGRFSIRDFYIRRFVRIIPIYYFVVSSVAFYYIIIDDQTQYLEILPYYYLFLSNFLVGHIPTLSPSWSLSVEEQYYLIWPALLMILSKRLVVPVLTLLIIGNVAIMTGWVWTHEPLAAGPLVFRMPNATYAPILMGSLAAVVLHNRSAFRAVFPILSHWTAPLVGFSLLLIAMEFLPVDLRGIPNLIIHSIMTLILAALVVKEKNIFSDFLTNRIVSRIGVISYGIYIYHLLALDITSRAFSVLEIYSPWLILIVYSIVSCFFAEISFRTLEAYFLKFRTVSSRSGSVRTPSGSIS